MDISKLTPQKALDQVATIVQDVKATVKEHTYLGECLNHLQNAVDAHTAMQALPPDIHQAVEQTNMQKAEDGLKPIPPAILKNVNNQKNSRSKEKHDA